MMRELLTETCAGASNQGGVSSEHSRDGAERKVGNGEVTIKSNEGRSSLKRLSAKGNGEHDKR